jgi:hypothetical protein
VKKILREIPLSIKTVFITLHHPLFARGPLNIRISDEIFEMVGTFGSTAKLLFHPMLLWDKIYNSRYFSERFLANEKGQALRLLEAIREGLAGKGIELFILFGHRHEGSLTRVGQIVFEEAPNIAPKNTNDFGFGFYALDRNATSQIEAHWCPVVERPEP